MMEGIARGSGGEFDVDVSAMVRVEDGRRSSEVGASGSMCKRV